MSNMVLHLDILQNVADCALTNLPRLLLQITTSHGGVYFSFCLLIFFKAELGSSFLKNRIIFLWKESFC